MSAPIHPLTVRGDAYAVGRAIGDAIAPHMRAVTLASAEFKALDERWRGSDWVAELLARASAAFPDIRRELQGMADGAGLDFDTLFLWNCRGDLRFEGQASPRLTEALASGCTTIMRPARDGSDAVIAHNEDGAEELDGHCFWVRVEPEGGDVPFTSFLYPGMLPGHTVAVNDAGLVQTINNIRPGDLKSGVPRHFIARAVLNCRRLEDAVDLLERNDRASGFHHALGSASEGRILSVEAPASGCQVTEVREPMAHANHLINPALAAVPQVVTQSSAFRQQAADDMVRDGRPSEDILFHKGDRATTSIHRRPSAEEDDYGFTLATAVFQLSPAGVEWRLHKDAATRDMFRGSVSLDN